MIGIPDTQSNRQRVVYYFSSWREDNVVYSRTKLYDREMSNGMDEEAFEALWESVEDEYYRFCEDNNFEPCMDE